MILFLDTEFTDFTDPELISIGLVSEDGREFYAERHEFDRSKCSDFVREKVLPRLVGTPPVSKSLAELRTSLTAWLAQFPEAVVVFDYTGDWTLMCAALGAQPAGFRPFNAWDMLASRLPERALLDDTDSPSAHNALADARALRADWIAAGGDIERKAP